MFDASSLVGNRFGSTSRRTVEVFAAFLLEGRMFVIASIDNRPLRQYPLSELELYPCPETRMQPF